MNMTLTFLGTGTSCGTPVVGCECRVCHSPDPKDIRTRASAMVETDTTRVVIDCGPDFRQQMLRQPFRKIDGILITHHHYDHVGGLDDVRPFCVFGDINVYADEENALTIRHNFPYCFAERKYPGVPRISLHAVAPHEPLTIGDLTIVPIRVMHGQLPILGFRIGPLAYITDMKTLPDTEWPCLEGVEVLVVNALRFTKPHFSHQLVDDAVAFAQRVGARRTLFIHSCHDIGRHEEVNGTLPKGIEMAYDGQKIALQ